MKKIIIKALLIFFSFPAIKAMEQRLTTEGIAVHNLIKAIGYFAKQDKPESEATALRVLGKISPSVQEALKKLPPQHNLNYKDEGKSALHYAAEKGYTDLVRALLGAGVDKNLPDDQGNTPLALAQANTHEDTVALLED